MLLLLLVYLCRGAGCGARGLEPSRGPGCNPGIPLAHSGSWVQPWKPCARDRQGIDEGGRFALFWHSTADIYSRGRLSLSPPELPPFPLCAITECPFPHSPSKMLPSTNASLPHSSKTKGPSLTQAKGPSLYLRNAGSLSLTEKAPHSGNSPFSRINRQWCLTSEIAPSPVLTGNCASLRKWPLPRDQWAMAPCLPATVLACPPVLVDLTQQLAAPRSRGLWFCLSAAS